MATLFTTDAQPREREPARVPLDLAWESSWWARQYAGTTAQAWAAYLSGSGEAARFVALGHRNVMLRRVRWQQSAAVRQA